jgi:phage gp46-like protein
MATIIDIAFHETGSGGDINLTPNYDIDTVKGLFNQVYLALFGGNVEQSTSEFLQDSDERFDWWGNKYLQEEYQFNSSFEKALYNNALTSSGLSKITEAAKKDLKYLRRYADIDISANIISRDRMKLIIYLRQPDKQTPKIIFIWDRTKNEIIEQSLI